MLRASQLAFLMLQAKLEELLGPALLTAFLAVRRDEAAASPSIETLLLRY